MDERREDWRDVFSGRRKELEVLQRAFARVASDEGAGPEVVVVTGDQGLGKTRLAQAFYAWLATEIDPPQPNGYWPDALKRERDALAVNPEPQGCLSKYAMPFLWWGVRVADSENIASNLHAARPRLTPHLEPMMKSRRKLARLKTERAGQALDAGKLVAGLTLGALPLGGTVLNLVDVGQLAWGVWRTSDEAFKDEAVRSPREVDAAQLRDIVEDFHADLSILLDPRRKEMATVPVVIFIDDAQFAHRDGALLALLDQLLESAFAKNWRLLLVATHWTREWQEDLAADRDACLAGVMKRRVMASRPDWAPMALGAEPDLRALIEAGLPGLTEPQIALVLERGGGNPRLLQEIVARLKASPRAFDGPSDGGPLSTFGEDLLRTAEFKLEALIFERFMDAERTSPQMRDAVGLASVQGMRFLADLTARVAAHLNADSVPDGLAEAHAPHRLITPPEAGVAEFVQRVYRDAANAALREVFDRDAVETALEEAARALADDDAALDALPAAAQEAALGLIARKFESADDATDRARSERAFGRLAAQEIARGDRYAALKAAERILKPVFEDLGLARSYDPILLDDALRAYETWGRYDETAPVRRALLERFRGTADHDVVSKIALARELAANGNVVRRRQGAASALRYSEECVSVNRELAELLDAPQATRNLVLGLLQLGDLRLELDGPEAALPLYAESVSLSRELARAPRNPDAQASYSTSLSRDAEGGFVMSLSGAGAGAILYSTAFTSADAARSLSVALEKLGDVALCLEGPESALALFEESVESARSLWAETQAPNDALNLAAALHKLGDVSWDLNGAGHALAYYEESIAPARHAAASLQLPEAFRGLSFSLKKLADSVRLSEAPEAARTYLNEAVVLDRDLLAVLCTLEAKRDLSISLRMLGDVVHTLDGPGAARPSLEESVELAGELLEAQGTQDASYELAQGLFRLACVDAAEDQRGAAISRLGVARRLLAPLAACGDDHAALLMEDVLTLANRAIDA